MISRDEFEKRLLNVKEPYDSMTETELKTQLIDIHQRIEALQELQVRYGRLIDYNDLKKRGYTLEQIEEIFKEDEKLIEFSRNNVESHFKYDHEMMFGYPANMADDSYVIKYLRQIEGQMYYTNSCGNAYSQGNYRMNNSPQELEIIKIIKENLGLDENLYWGYITAGGTEGNMWGIREGFCKYPNGLLYFSDTAHYSVAKMGDMFGEGKCVKIPSNKEKIDVDVLINEIVNNYNKTKSPAILVLSFGTTTLGSIDDIDIITERLDKLNIPYYVHVDAALYGGIPRNQINSPAEKFDMINKGNINSISVSMHKYVGSQRTNGILLSKSKNYQRFIEYIANQDITFLGSRDFPTFSLVQRVRELYKRTDPTEYQKNILYFEQLLRDNNIGYIKGEDNGNIFVIESPSEEICKKYQLAEFTRDGIKYAHVIIFPYHSEIAMNQLVGDIKRDRGITREFRKD